MVLLSAAIVAVQDRLAKPTLTRFDPARMGVLEASMWRNYYEHRWAGLAMDGLRVSCGEYGFSWWDGVRTSVLAARAAHHFRGDTHDPRCAPLLERYYALIEGAFDQGLDEVEAARLELEWWRERRRRLKAEQYGRTIAANLAVVYGLPVDTLAPAALARARAMDYRDARGRRGVMTEADWVEVSRQLTEAYALLKEAARPGGFLTNGVTAHRGSSLEHPENTMPAFRHALELGVDWIELDIFTTIDGHLVVHHDAMTRATSDRDLAIARTSLADLRELDVAHHFRTKHRLSLAECPEETMPLLSEVLDLVLGQHRTRVSIQPKDGSVDAAIRLIDEKKARAWCGFNDGSLPKMARVKALVPGIPVFWDRPASFDADADAAIAKQHGFEALVIHQDGITAEVIARLRDSGFETGAWTVNDPEKMREFVALGIDRIYTDDPRTLLGIMGR